MGRGSAIAAVCVCAMLVGANEAHAQYFGRNKVHYDQLEFRTLQTEHFDLYYYEEEAAASRDAARMAERWYWRYSTLLHHTFSTRQPIVLYASHAHFSQTNLTPGIIGESTGGFTEAIKSRIAIPFAPGLGETDHVLGHEIAHAFQIAVAKQAGHDAFALPLWFIEGMAEYLSLGPSNAHTGMWMRDAALHEDLPSIAQLADTRYSPYRYGHAFWTYLCAAYGDDVLGRVLRARGNALARLAAVTGMDEDRLTRDWHATIGAPEIAHAAGADREVITPDDARLHVSPALSPDGRRIMFLSERDRLSLDLFMADATTGRILQKIVSTAADPHFDSLEYIQSAGAWAPDGTRFALSAVAAGTAVLVIVDPDEADDREEIRLTGVSESYSPSWSPDGSRIVLSGLKNGYSDLFVYTLATGALEQLTQDAFADLQPVWSPDGRSIAFATDRFTTTLGHLRWGPLRVALMDVATASIRELWPESGGGKQINPQWHPAGDALYVVSDRDGTSNVYRVGVAAGDLRRVTNVSAGVSGVTATSPALAVAARSGLLAVSVYQNGRYMIERIADADAAAGSTDARGADALMASAVAPPAHSGPAPGPVLTNAGAHSILSTPAAVFASATAPAGDRTPPPFTVASLLRDAAGGLPSTGKFTSSKYDDRLRLESISHPYIGAAAGGAFGGALRGGFGLTFGDVLKDRQLQISVTAGTRVDDFAAQVAYTNRKEQWNWGVAAGFQPARFFGARAAIDSREGLVTRETSNLRYIHQWGGLVGQYHIDRARRIEVGAGLRRTGFQWQTLTRVVDQADGRVLSRTREDTPGGHPIFLVETRAAFVHDTSVSGPLGPLVGRRLRVEIEPAFGPLLFADVRADARQYAMPVRPFTLAARFQHVGRYGADAADPRLTPLVAGLQTLVRGYDLTSFAADRCGRTARSCSIIDELTGSRFALLNLEVRAPIPGAFSRQIAYGRTVPVEAIAFVDAGYLWTRSAAAANQDRFRSAGAGARVNLGGIIMEIAAARPFDRGAGGWTTSFLIRPGW